MIFCLIAFTMFIIFDLNKVIWNYKKLNALFALGIAILAYGTYECFIAGMTAAEMMECIISKPLFAALALFGLWKTYSVLFKALPFDETYRQTDKLSLVDTGVYGKCRHPGFWFLLMTYASLCVVFFSKTSLGFTVLVNLLNLGYIIAEDVFVFPRTIENYNEYRKRVPFLVPRIK